MKLKRITQAIALIAITMPFSLTAAQAYELVIPGLMYRTGPYAPNGIPFANGFSDYLNMLNARDGVLKGLKLNIPNARQVIIRKEELSATKVLKGLPLQEPSQFSHSQLELLTN